MMITEYIFRVPLALIQVESTRDLGIVIWTV